MEIGTSATKVYEVRSRSPGRVIVEHKVMEPPLGPPLGSFAAASTAAYDRSTSPPRRYMGGGSPLRSSYRPTYTKY